MVAVTVWGAQPQMGVRQYSGAVPHLNWRQGKMNVVVEIPGATADKGVRNAGGQCRRFCVNVLVGF
jgi:hypothetical protein